MFSAKQTSFHEMMLGAEAEQDSLANTARLMKEFIVKKTRDYIARGRTWKG